MRVADITAGMPARVEFSKFDGTPHWVSTGTVLGRDEFGVWIGMPIGSVFTRPGARIVADNFTAMLASADRQFMLSRYSQAQSSVEQYVDLTTVPELSIEDSTLVIRAIDLDLDVVLEFDATEAWIDDADEFAEHQVTMNYPESLIASTESETYRIREEMSSAVEPFNGVSQAYLRAAQELPLVQPS